MKSSILAVSLAVSSIWAQAPTGAPSAGSSPTSETIQRLLDRIDALESRLRALESANKSAIDGQSSALSPIPPATASLTTSEQPSASVHVEERDHMQGLLNSPQLSIKGFTDFTYNRGGPENSFSVGQLDLFVTSKISEKAAFVGEIVFEVGPDNAGSMDVERALFQYRQNDFLKAEIGRYHSSIGYYNSAFHHGTWFQTTIERPVLFRWEDGGGVLPIHNVGTIFSGRIPAASALGLRYIAEIGNGRNYSGGAEPVQSVHDFTPGKAWNLALISQPDAWHGWRFGASYYHDTPLVNASRLSQTILAGSVIYIRGKEEALNEVIWMRHNQFGRVTSIPAFYSQYSHRFGVLRPYVRWQYINGSSRDPIASLVMGDEKRYRSLTTGIRYDFNEFAAFKLEWERYKPAFLSPANRVAAQLAFTF